MKRKGWGGEMREDKVFFWSDWFLDQLMLGFPLCKMPDYTVPEEWLEEIFDNERQVYLMPMPVNIFN